ncbi:sensor domain-containing diguanylate cyclase [Chitinolyticbacter albus]|uniref:sensor domain-containing diguanylate cyclase n=1 Tax=Chitinolyticbacter albus TaxID=2961951 RepID=UPI002109BA73|nr:diguanylate cyclase [Chitinolyticbacter albus]
MPKETEARHGFSTGVHKSSLQWKYGALAATLIVWLTIGISALQIWWNLKATESRTYSHLVDTSHHIDQAMYRFFAENRTLARTILDQFPPDSASASSPCQPICSETLLALQRRYVELFPGIDILIVDPQGQIVAATEKDMQNRIGGLAEIATHFRTDRNARAMLHYAKNSRNEHAVLMAWALRSATGELFAIGVFIEPVTQLAEIIAAPQLGPGRAVTISDARGVLLARDPKPELVHPGQLLRQYIEEQRPARGMGSFRAVSKIDGLDRLFIKRDIPFSQSSDGLVLWVGMSTDDYLAEWRRSALLTLFSCCILLAGWIWGLFVLKHDAQSTTRLLGSVRLMHKVIESAPVPTVVVSQQEGRVVMSNATMLNAFGALAAVGQPVRPLFGEETLPKLLSAGENVTPVVVELLSRNGPIHAELYHTDLGDFGEVDDPCSLVVLVDVSERHKRELHLKLAATTDVLTGLINRRHFNYEAEQAIAAARQQGTPLAVLVLDLDHFKRVNDEHGHDIGDVVLATMAQVIKVVLREGDLAARMGGEEFATLLPKADRQQAMAVAERIRQAVAATPIMLPDNQVLGVTVSIGVGIWQAHDTDIHASLKRADLALYVAKENGRNRVVADETGDSPPG